MFDPPTRKSHLCLQTRDTRRVYHQTTICYSSCSTAKNSQFMLKVRSVAQVNRVKCAAAFSALHLVKMRPIEQLGDDIPPFRPWKVSTSTLSRNTQQADLLTICEITGGWPHACWASCAFPCTRNIYMDFDYGYTISRRCSAPGERCASLWLTFFS